MTGNNPPSSRPNIRTFLNQMEKLSQTGEKLSFLSRELGHKLAYFVIGLQAAISGYILYNSSRFKTIPYIEYLFLGLGITIFLGLLWLLFYSLNVHFAGSALSTQMYFYRWVKIRHAHNPLPSLADYEAQFEKETKGLLNKAKRNQKRAATGFWVWAQYLWYSLFVLGTCLTIGWIIMAGFIFLSANLVPESLP